MFPALTTTPMPASGLDVEDRGSADYDAVDRGGTAAREGVDPAITAAPSTDTEKSSHGRRRLSGKQLTSIVLAPAMLASVATAGLALTASPASAQTQVNQLTNGSFDQGTVGWAPDTSSTKLSIATDSTKGQVAELSSAVRARTMLTDKPDLARAAEAGQPYTASALVRSTQSGQTGRIVIRQRVPGQSTRYDTATFPLTSTWTPVTVTAKAVTAGATVDVRVRGNDQLVGKKMYVDNVSLATTPSFTNGSLYNERGIPSSAGTALLGSAYGGNTNPATWETQMGHNLGVHRTYWGPTNVTSAVNTAKSDLANHRLPWISFKLPYSWTDMANGKGDAWATDLATRLAALDGPVWLAFHHEPEGDGAITEWTRMQAHLAPLVRAAAPNVAYSIVLTGWNQFYGPTEYRLDAMMPKNTKIDLLGMDIYDKYGVVKNGVPFKSHTDFQKDYFSKIAAWTQTHDMAWGLAETGFSDPSFADKPTWVQDTFNQMTQSGGIAFTYFNTTLNSVSSWTLGNNQAKEDSFAAALRTAPSLR